MQNIIQRVFKAKKATQKLHGITEGTIWRTATDDPDEDDARDTLAIKEAGFKRSDFFKPVRVDHLVVDDMPMEGVFDTAFCDRYKLAEDGKSWLLPASAAQSGSTDSGTGENSDSISEGHTDESATDNADNTDSGDTTSTASTDTGAATAATDSDSATSAAGAANAAADTSDEVAGSETATTATDEPPAYEFNVNGERMADVEKEMQQPVAGMDDRHRILSQFILEDKFSHNITPEQLAEVSRLELDVSDNYIQDMLLATRNAPAIHKLSTPDLWKYTDSFKKVFARDKRHPLSRMINFNQAYADAHPIDRGLLVKEWIKGNYMSRVEKMQQTTAGDTSDLQNAKNGETGSSTRPRRSEKPTHRTINYELGCGFYDDLDFDNLRPAMDFAKRIIAEDREDWKRMSITAGIIPDIKEFDRQTIIDLVRKAPKAVLTGSPELRRTWCESFLAVHGVRDPDWYEHTPDNAPATHEENSARIRKAGKSLRDIKEGRFNDVEEKPQPAAVLADEPAASEAVEQDTTEHHPDPQPLENEPPVSQTEAGYQKIRAELHEARKNIPPKNPVDVGKQLAAARGEYVEGISDPNDPKWVHHDYSASNEGEKTEVATDRTEDTADEADHSEEFSNQTGPETNHSEPSTGHNEPEAPETEPKSLQPEPVTKVADGVFDVSAFFADTSNQGEKTEIPPPNNDDRSQECVEEKATDVPATAESLLHEMVRLQSINNQLLEACIAYQSWAETRQERFLEALFYGITRFAYQWVEGEEDRESEEKLRGDS
ncbi:hypothetical protein L2D25_07780 [Salmonella enterica subsp. enterica serovar Muenchen]|nr:RecE family exodeoxyribonuclease [Salmonella enterica]MCH5441370.1 hypothetical protein [Salmonella enterica subsp. enterica serovar Muenchen]